MNNRVIVAVPATTANMGPGFDCLGMSLALYNQVEMSVNDNGLEIVVEGQGARHIAGDDKNIVYRAARRVFQEAGREMPGLFIKLINQIPASRGLGSSAAAIVGGLVAANKLTGSKLSQERLLEIATELEGHPDNVAPALLGGIIVSVMQEGKVYSLKINPPEGLHTVVAVPDFHLSTHAAREVLPKQVSMQDAIFNLSRAALMVGAICEKRLDLLHVAGSDALHQPYRSKLVPGMNEVIAAAMTEGALNVTLSGAGPTVIALTQGKNQNVMTAMEQAFQRAGVKCMVKTLKPTVEGARIL